MSETIRVALGGLTANKLRSGLTILGLMIGVGSVIVLIAVGTGSSSAVQQQIDALGSNVLTVTSNAGLGGLFGRAQASSSELTMADVQALDNKSEAPDVKTVSPVVNANGVTSPTTTRRTNRHRSLVAPRAIRKRATTSCPPGRGSRARRSATTAA